MEKIFGIDLGTTYSCIAYVDEHGKPVVVNNSENELTTPSVIYFESSKNIVVGSAAKEVAEVYPKQVVSTVKRVMGDPDWRFEYDSKEYTAQEISSYILEKVVKDASENINEDIKDVVITVPAYFGINEKEATKQAGELAGLNVKAIIPEPTAAAIAYGIESNKDEVVLVYDLGGGTFDITVIAIKENGITVISTSGDHQLGGRNWDERLAEYFAQVFEDETGVDKDGLLGDSETWQELLNKAEDAKKSLTSKEKTTLRVSFDGDKATVNLTRDKFNDLTNDLLERTISLTDEVLENIKNERGIANIDKILLVGGSTYMPQIREALEKNYSYETVVHDPNLSVAKGAAIFGYKLSLDEEIKFQLSETTGKKIEDIDLNEIDDSIIDEVVKKVSKKSGYSIGGARELVSKKIINVTAKSFGIEVLNENEEPKIANLIKVDAEIPIEITRAFPTAYEGQTGVELVCYENIQRVGPEDDTLLDLDTSTEIGRSSLDFGEALPKGSLVDITFKLSEDGLLEVYAKDQTTNRDIEASFVTESIITSEKMEELKEERKNIKVS